MTDPNPVQEWRDRLDALESAVESTERTTVEDMIVNLVTAATVASAWGITANAIGNIRARHSTFPEPVVTFGKTPVYWAPEIDAFMRAYTMSRQLRPTHIPGVRDG